MKKKTEPKCLWKEDSDGNWEASCDQVFCMTEGTPSENTYNYCPNCGKRLIEVRYRERSKGI